MKTNKNIYANLPSFLDKLVLKKRYEITEVIKKFIIDKNISSVLDIGTTEDFLHKSSNYIIFHLGKFKNHKSISDQTITSNFFTNKLCKSITSDFTKIELENFKSDLVISNATIEHVGDFKNQLKMCRNIAKLSKKFFVIITPNRYHPIDFHTKLPFLHWLPKKIHRAILCLLGFHFLSKEKNLNLLSFGDLETLIKNCNNVEYKMYHINFLFFKSNLILIAQIKKTKEDKLTIKSGGKKDPDIKNRIIKDNIKTII